MTVLRFLVKGRDGGLDIFTSVEIVMRGETGNTRTREGRNDCDIGGTVAIEASPTYLHV